MKTKIEIVNKSYAWLRISGLTVDPSPEDSALALDELEVFMATLEARNVCTNYNFEESPDANSDSGIAVAYEGAAEKGLAQRLADAFGKTPPENLVRMATAGISEWAAATASYKQIAPPNSQPRGSGTTFRFPRWLRYYRIDNGAPISCDTFEIKVDQVDYFGVDFTNYLISPNTISSYTIEDIQGGIEILQDQLNGNRVEFQAKGISAGTATITINVTTTSDRINPEKVYFNVTD